MAATSRSATSTLPTTRSMLELTSAKSFSVRFRSDASASS